MVSISNRGIFFDTLVVSILNPGIIFDTLMVSILNPGNFFDTLPPRFVTQEHCRQEIWYLVFFKTDMD
jgi:hypothetical protein